MFSQPQTLGGLGAGTLGGGGLGGNAAGVGLFQQQSQNKLGGGGLFGNQNKLGLGGKEIIFKALFDFGPSLWGQRSVVPKRILKINFVDSAD